MTKWSWGKTNGLTIACGHTKAITCNLVLQQYTTWVLVSLKTMVCVLQSAKTINLLQLITQTLIRYTDVTRSSKINLCIVLGLITGALS